MFGSLEVVLEQEPEALPRVGVDGCRLGEDGVGEGCGSRALARIGQGLRKLEHGALGELGVGLEHRQYRRHVHVRFGLVPAVVVGGQGQRGVGQLGFSRQLGFGHGRHADHAHAPPAVDPALGPGRELRAFHADVGPAHVHGAAGAPRRRGQRLG